MKRIIFFTIALLPILLLSETQWQDNGIPVRCGENLNWQGETVNSSDGNFVLVWSDSRNGGRGIFAQKVSPDGNLLWGETGINVNDETYSQHHPKAVANSDNEIVIAWHCIYSFTEKEVRIQKIDALGNRLWSDSGVSVITDSNIAYDVHIIDDQAGGAFVLWRDLPSFEFLKGLHVLEDGSIDSNWAVGGNLLVEAYGGDLFGAVSDGESGFIISWKASPNIYAQRIDPNGNQLWGDQGVVVRESTVQNQFSSFSQDSSGNTYYFWNSNHSIYMQKLSEDGIIQFTEEILLYTSELEIKKIISIVTTDNNLAISWIEQDYNQGAIKTVKLDISGNLLWDELVIIESNDIYWFYNPNMIPDNNGGYWLKWFYYGQSGDLYVQHIYTTGDITLTANGFLICDEVCDRNINAMNLTEDGRAFLSWYDNREGNSSLYIQNLDDQGNLLFPINGQVVYEGSAIYCSDLRIIPNNDNPIFIWANYIDFYQEAIFMQSLNADGSPVFDEEGIILSETQGSSFLECELSSLNDNHAIISKISNNNYYYAKAQSFDNLGNLLWGDGVMVTSSGQSQYNVKISSVDDYYLAGWTEFNGDWDNPETNIYAQKLDESGNLLWGETGVLISDLNIDNSLKDIAGRCYIWEDETFTENTIYAKLVDENGNTAPGWEENGTVITNSEFMDRSPVGLEIPEGYLVLWQNHGDSDVDIWGQIITENGNVLWEQGGLPLVEKPGYQQPFEFEFDENLYLVWQDHRTGNFSEIYAQKFDENGSELWQPGGVIIGEGYQPDIEKIGDHFLIVWEKPDIENMKDIYAQLVSLDGEILWNPQGERICDAFLEQRKPQIVKNETNDVYIGWLDDRVFNEDLEGGDYMISVFAQKYHIESTFTPDEILNVITSKLYQNFPNPFNPSGTGRSSITTIEFSLQSDSKVKLAVYNIKGQKIKTLTNNEFSKGLHTVIWNGDDEHNKSVSSGVYLYKLKVNGKIQAVNKCLLLK